MSIYVRPIYAQSWLDSQPQLAARARERLEYKRARPHRRARGAARAQRGAAQRSPECGEVCSLNVRAISSIPAHFCFRLFVNYSWLIYLR